MVLFIWKCIYPNLVAELIIYFPTLPKTQCLQHKRRKRPKPLCGHSIIQQQRAVPAEHVAPSENNIPSEATSLSTSPLFSGTEPKQIHINRYQHAVSCQTLDAWSAVQVQMLTVINPIQSGIFFFLNVCNKTGYVSPQTT